MPAPCRAVPCHPSMYIPVPDALINLSTLTCTPPTPLTPYLSSAAPVLWVCLAQPCPLCLFTCLWGFLPSPVFYFHPMVAGCE